MLAEPPPLSHLWLTVKGKKVKGFFASSKYFSFSGHEVKPDSWEIRDWQNELKHES